MRQDDTEATRWFRSAADQDNTLAQTLLGIMYRDGRGVPQDYAEAIRWFRLAADQGDADAQDCLGSTYANGRGVPQDNAEAIRWYRLAANQGHSRSFCELGMLADRGYAEALLFLGLYFTSGDRARQHDVTAHMYLNLAVSRLTGETRDRATRARHSVETRLTAEQRAEAQRLAREWNDTHPRD